MSRNEPNGIDPRLRDLIAAERDERPESAPSQAARDRVLSRVQATIVAGAGASGAKGGHGSGVRQAVKWSSKLGFKAALATILTAGAVGGGVFVARERHERPAPAVAPALAPPAPAPVAAPIVVPDEE